MGFGLDVRAWCERVKDQKDLVVRKIALELFSRVILKSPVKTGRFRANWQVTISSKAQSSLILEDKTGQATISRAQADLAGVNAGDRIFLTNNLVYARRLEYGWSKQAPAGMVGITVAEFQQVIDKSVAEVKSGQTR